MRKPYLLNLVLDDNEAWKKKVMKEYGIEGLKEIRMKELLPDGEVEVKPFAFMEGGSLPTDLALLKIMASSFEACNYFEIGTWRGESVANVAAGAAECTTLNLPSARMKELGMTEDYIAQHAMFSKHLSNVTHLEGDSLSFDFAGLGKKYDLIFIDGDHHYDPIRQDTINVFEHLVHEKSIVVWHDYAWQPGDVRYETMAAILSGVPIQLRDKVYAARNTMCAIFYPGEIDAYLASAIANPEEAFTLNLKI